MQSPRGARSVPSPFFIDCGQRCGPWSSPGFGAPLWSSLPSLVRFIVGGSNVLASVPNLWSKHSVSAVCIKLTNLGFVDLGRQINIKLCRGNCSYCYHWSRLVWPRSVRHTPALRPKFSHPNQQPSHVLSSAHILVPKPVCETQFA